MSNTDTRPEEIHCRTEDLPIRDPLRPRVEIITSREVPLGGPRAMPVRRTLPQRQRSLIGAWCKRFEEQAKPAASRRVNNRFPSTSLKAKLA